jgi:hypothetical protein
MSLPDQPFLQKDVLWWMNLDRPSVSEMDRLTAIELLLVERSPSSDKQVHLYLRCLFNQIRRSVSADGSPKRVCVNVEVGRERRDESGNVSFIDRRNEVDVNRRSGFAGKGRRDRTPDCVEDSEILEYACYRNRRRNGIDRRGHRSMR